LNHNLDRNEIEKILPHRDPFLFVDEIQEIALGEKIVGIVRVGDKDTFLHRDEAGIPHLPPTILTEAMAQVGAVLVLFPEENRGRTIFFRSIDDIRFDKRVPAGSSLRILGEVRKMRGRLGSLKMSAFLGDDLVAEGVMGFAL
jgi:3-hydroxyacyl-[acyl-carrier-protein] dehydratase